MRKVLCGKHLILWFCVIMMTGCVSGGKGLRIGRQFDTIHVNDIQKGQTMAEIRDWFGKPYSTGVSEKVDENGRPLSESWVYYFSVARIGRTDTQALTIAFDSAGKVITSSYDVISP